MNVSFIIGVIFYRQRKLNINVEISPTTQFGLKSFRIHDIRFSTAKRDRRLPTDFQLSFIRTHAFTPRVWGPCEIEIRLYVNRDWTVNRVAGTWQNTVGRTRTQTQLRFKFRTHFRGLRNGGNLPGTKDNQIL